MSTRVKLAIATGAALIGLLIWYFWDDIRVLLEGGETIEDDSEEDVLAEDISLTHSESSRMALLLPQVQRALQDTINDLASQGIKVFVGQTKRSESQEKANLASGASGTMHSWHLLGRAADVYPIDPKTDQPDLQGRNFETFKTMHQTAAKYGFTNISFYGDWTKRLITTSKGKIWDGGHMQFTEGKTWADASAESVA